MTRLLLALTFSFWLGFYAAMHAESITCRAINGHGPALAWINC